MIMSKIRHMDMLADLYEIAFKIWWVRCKQVEGIGRSWVWSAGMKEVRRGRKTQRPGM